MRLSALSLAQGLRSFVSVLGPFVRSSDGHSDRNVSSRAASRKRHCHIYYVSNSVSAVDHKGDVALSMMFLLHRS